MADDHPELLWRLRNYSRRLSLPGSPTSIRVVEEAADAIESLTSRATAAEARAQAVEGERDALRKALEPFGEAWLRGVSIARSGSRGEMVAVAANQLDSAMLQRAAALTPAGGTDR